MKGNVLDLIISAKHAHLEAMAAVLKNLLSDMN